MIGRMPAGVRPVPIFKPSNCRNGNHIAHSSLVNPRDNRPAYFGDPNSRFGWGHEANEGTKRKKRGGKLMSASALPR
eukprot:6327642-Pyramimonas_sp.AAC.1